MGLFDNLFEEEELDGSIFAAPAKAGKKVEKKADAKNADAKKADAKKADAKKASKKSGAKKVASIGRPNFDAQEFAPTVKLITAFGTKEVSKKDGGNLNAPLIRGILMEANEFQECCTKDMLMMPVNGTDNVIAVLDRVEAVDELAIKGDVVAGGFSMHCEPGKFDKTSWEPFMRSSKVYKVIDNTYGIWADGEEVTELKSGDTVEFFGTVEKDIKAEDFIKNIIGGEIPDGVKASIIAVPVSVSDEEEEEEQQSAETTNVLQFWYSGKGASDGKKTSSQKLSFAEKQKKEDEDYMNQPVKLPVKCVMPWAAEEEYGSDMFEGKSEITLLELFNKVKENNHVFDSLEASKKGIQYYGSHAVISPIAKEKGGV